MKKPKINRGDMLKLLPRNSICAEIGVCEGEYTQSILDYANPKRLFLVDIWGHITLSYNDNNMVDNQRHEVRYRQVASKFINYENVYLIRAMSTAMPEIFPQNYFDWTYVDADHSYEGCKTDLEISKNLTKPDGYILGHDYKVDFQGVIDSVHELVEKNNYFLTLITTDKNASYLISKTQKAHDFIMGQF